MDVALTVAERVTMMHNGRVIVEGTPGRDPGPTTLVHDLYLGRGTTQRAMSDIPPGHRGPPEPTTPAHQVAPRRDPSRWGRSRWRSSVATAWARRLCATRSWGSRPPRASGSVRFDGEGADRKAAAQDRPRGPGLRPAGETPLPLAHGRRAPRHRSQERRSRGGPRNASTTSFPGWPSGSGTAAPSFPAASSRCSRSAERCSAIRGS